MESWTDSMEQAIEDGILGTGAARPHPDVRAPVGICRLLSFPSSKSLGAQSLLLMQSGVLPYLGQ